MQPKNNSTLTVWVVTHNTAGYLPEADPYASFDYESARQVYISLWEDMADFLHPDAVCECGEDGGELCEVCGTQAYAGAVIADVRTLPVGVVFGERYRSDSMPLPIEVWLMGRNMTLVDAIAEFGEDVMWSE